MSDLKFDIDGKDLSSEQINAGKKNFDQFYQNYVTKTKPFYQKGWFWGTAGLASVAVVAGLMLSNPDGPSDSLAGNVPSETINDTNDTSNASKASSGLVAIEEDKPFVNPPIEGVNVPWEKLTVDAAKGGTVTNKRGSTINFPEGSFVDLDGKPVNDGEVEIRYREFLDPIDQIVSGIPMTYDSAGTTYQFHSAGMIEVKGYKDGKEVKMAPDKAYDVALVSDNPGTEFNLYKLNEEKRNWDCLGKDKVVTKSEPKGPKVSPQEIENRIQKAPEYQKLEKKKIAIQKEIAAIEAAAPKAPIKANKDLPNFNFDYDTKEFPELGEYSNVLFQLEEGQKINPADAQKTWNDIAIEKQEDKYKVVFKEQATDYKVSYLARPVYEGKSYEEAKAIFDGKHSAYTEKLTERKKAEAEVINKIQAIKRKIEQVAQTQNEATDMLVQRLFEVRDFGITNCDQPLVRRRFNRQQIRVNLVAYDGRPKVLENVYYINSTANTYFRRELAVKKNTGFAKSGTNSVLLLKDGKYAFIDSKKFKKDPTKKGNFQFGELKEVKSYRKLKEDLDF